MVTRMYPASAPTGGLVTPSSWSAGWNKTAGAGTKELLLWTEALYTNVNLGGITASGTSGHFTAQQRFISQPLLPQTIAGTVKGQFLCNEVAAGDNFTLAFAIKVIQADGSDRGVLIGTTASDDTAATPPEMVVTTPTNRRLLNSAESASITLSSLAVSAGDRLVFEFGVRQASTATSAPAIFACADSALGDLAENDTATTAANAWIEFSQDIAFGVTFYREAATPAGLNAVATGTADPTAVTPPTGMRAGDLVCMIGHQRATGATLAVSQASGQTWNSLTAIGGTTITARVFWCVFNGTWGSDPSVDFSAAVCNSVQMLTFRPPTNHFWAINVAQVELDIAAAPHTITGQTTLRDNPTLTLAGWFTADDNQWGNIAGGTWQVCGDSWYINQSGSDQSSSYAYLSKIGAGATGNVTKDQTALGDDPSTTFIVTFEAVPKPPPPAVVLQSVARAASF